MKLISLMGFDTGTRSASGFVDDGVNFTEFNFAGGVLEMGHAYPKKNYRSYDHFVGVLGKFNPYTFFLEKPIILDALHFEAVQAAYESKQELFDNLWERLAAG